MSKVYRLAPVLAVLIASTAFGADAGCSSDTLTVLKEGTSTSGALKQNIEVMVQGLSDCLAKAGSTTPKFVLYLNGEALKNLHVNIPDRGHEQLQFFLDLTADNKDGWYALLRNPTLQPRKIPLSIGIDEGRPALSKVNDFQLVVVNIRYLVQWSLLFVFLGALFFWAARASDILREGGPPPPNGKRKAYSLARCQMAFWFFLIAPTFALVFLTTWSLDSISPGVLALMGISAGTGLAAAVVDTSKNGAAESQKKDLLAQKASLDADIVSLQNAAAAAVPAPAALVLQIADKIRAQNEAQAKIQEVDAQLATPANDNFINDLLCDATGMSFHRFQIVVWTIILGIVFIAKVWSELTMPDFGVTLLGLMGISSGTYIGFKFPEQKN
jgi:hypothetical protein